MKSIYSVEKYTKPPQLRFTEASLIKKLDELGIGRPSTYSSMVTTVQDRKYVELKDKEGETKKDSTAISVSEDIQIPKQIEVTAWYAPQIPVSQGPGDFWGLPGLILEVNTDKTTVLCSKIIMNPKEKVDIEAPKKGAIVTRSEYNETVKKKMEEMRSMYGGRKNNRRN